MSYIIAINKYSLKGNGDCIALRNLIFYFWSNIELTGYECSFMSQIIEKIKKKNLLDLF